MADGQVRWKAGAERKHGSTRLLAVEKTIHFATDRSVLALDQETARQVWSFSAGDIHLYAIDVRTGKLKP